MKVSKQMTGRKSWGFAVTRVRPTHKLSDEEQIPNLWHDGAEEGDVEAGVEAAAAAVAVPEMPPAPGIGGSGAPSLERISSTAGAMQYTDSPVPVNRPFLNRHPPSLYTLCLHPCSACTESAWFWLLQVVCGPHNNHMLRWCGSSIRQRVV